MRLGWNEIKQRAVRFSREWSAETREQAEFEINIRAAEVMGRLHDAMAAGGYAGHALERFLVRVLFCLFAEDTGIFDPLLMPADLVKAHGVLDRAVDRCYRTAPFQSDRQRVEFLFARYEALSAPLLPKGMKVKRVRYN